MTETDKQNPAPEDLGPRVTPDQMRDVNRLQLSRTNRQIAGVAGGLGRYFDVDPTLVRVVLVVLALFGGAGLWVYAAVWLFTPDEATGRAAIHTSPETRKVLLIIAAVIAGLSALGSGWGPAGMVVDGPTGALVPIGIVVLVVMLVTNRTRSPKAIAPTATPESATTESQPATQSYTATAPVYGGYTPPPASSARANKRGIVLVWPTLALIAISWGVIRLFTLSGGHVPHGSYAASALLITGLALVGAAFVGRGGGLILTGIIATVALAMTSFIGATGGMQAWGQTDSQYVVPKTSAQVPLATSIQAGEITLDLTEITKLDDLNGKTIHIDGQAASVRVILPTGLAANVNAEAINAGEIQVSGRSVSAGINPASVHTTLGNPEWPIITLDLQVRVGEIVVEEAAA